VNVSVGCEPARSLQNGVQSFIYLQLVNSGTLYLSFDYHIARTFVFRQAHIPLRKDGDDIARLQFQIARLVIFQYGFARAQPEQLGAQVDGIYALDNGIVPVDFRGIASQVRSETPGRSLSDRTLLRRLHAFLTAQRRPIIPLRIRFSRFSRPWLAGDVGHPRRIDRGHRRGWIGTSCSLSAGRLAISGCWLGAAYRACVRRLPGG